jgi:hypothetical protein
MAWQFRTKRWLVPGLRLAARNAPMKHNRAARMAKAFSLRAVLLIQINDRGAQASAVSCVAPFYARPVFHKASRL